MRVVPEYRRPVLVAWRIGFWFLVFVLITLMAVAGLALPGALQRKEGLVFLLSCGLVDAPFIAALAWLWTFLARRDRAWKAVEEALRRQGVEVDAHIVSKDFRDLQELAIYSVRYQFRPEFLVEARDGSLDHKLYNLEVGQRVRVVYLPQQPECSQLIWPVPARER